MNWDKGYSARYYAAIVDPATWRDVGRIELTGGTVSREYSGLRQSADIDCVDYDQGVEQWIRIYLDARSEDGSGHEPLFTGLSTSPDQNIKGRWTENSVQCYSVLKPADDVILTRGWYAPVEMSAVSLIRQLLAPVPAPFENAIEGEPKSLESAIVAEDGETNLTMIEKILAALNWDLRIAGDGSLTLVSNEDIGSVMTFDPLSFDVIETEIKVSADWYSCPNVFMAVNNDMTGIARDESDDSILSIQNRGREVWMYESGVSLGEDETIAQYATRRLAEEQRVGVSVSYDRRFVPGVMPGDLVTLHYPEQGLTGDYLVESQSITLGYGAKTSETLIGV